MDQNLDLEIITGQIVSVRFQKDMFLIASFRENNLKTVSIKGNILNPQIGIDYILKGKSSEHPKWGKQFDFSAYETVTPKDTIGIFKYIVNVCKFVGPSVGNKIIDSYGEKTLEVLKTTPEIVAKDIKGITLDRAIEIQKSLLDNEINEKVMVDLEAFLNVHGMRKAVIPKLINDYKSNAMDVISKNPYLITKYSGIGFVLADQVALKNRFDSNSPHRKRAAVLHVINENLSNGSTWIQVSTLIKNVYRLISIPSEQIEIFVHEMILNNEISMFNQKNIDFVTLVTVANEELLISKMLISILSSGI